MNNIEKYIDSNGVTYLPVMIGTCPSVVSPSCTGCAFEAGDFTPECESSPECSLLSDDGENLYNIIWVKEE